MSNDKMFRQYFDECRGKDWHLHDCVSHDGVGTPLEYAILAQERGLKSICITNHVEQIDHISGLYEIIPSRDIPRFQRCFESILEAREQCPDIEILFGVELENNPPFYDAMLEIVNELDFDYIIGSVHNVKGLNFSGKTSIPLLKKADPVALYEGYYLETLEFVKWGQFQTLGHGDLIRRNMVKVHPDVKPIVPRDILQDIFSLMIEKDIGLEVNTGGYFQHPQDCYPTREIIELAIECGVTKFTMGSDAHRPHDVGCGYDLFFNKNIKAE